MASRKKAGKALTTAKSKLPANWREQLKEDVAEESERVPAGTGNRISLARSGEFKFQGAELGEEIDVVIVDHAVYKAWYENEYDEDNPAPPSCAAIKLSADNIAPLEDSPNKQAEICADCPKNEWGSGRKEKGKACKDKHRTALLHGDAIDGDLVGLDVPVTSGAAFRKYLKNLNKAMELPSYAVLTKMIMSDKKDYQSLEFKLVRELSQSEVAEVMAKRKMAREMVLEAPDFSGYRASGRGGKAKARAGTSTKKRRSRVS